MNFLSLFHFPIKIFDCSHLLKHISELNTHEGIIKEISRSHHHITAKHSFIEHFLSAKRCARYFTFLLSLISLNTV